MLKNSISKIITIVLIAILCLVNTSCEKKDDSKNFTVEGHLNNLHKADIYAIKQVTIDSLVIDTIKVSEKGDFLYEGYVDAPTMVSLFCYEDPISFVLEPNYNVKITGNIAEPDLVEIRGGLVNDEISKFKAKNASLLQSRYRILSKNDKLDLAELKNVNLQLARNVREYVEHNPAKISSVVLMNEYSINNTSVELLGQDISLLRGAALDFYLTTNLKAYYDRVKISAVGAIAPPITLKSTKGKDVSLSDFKGKPVLLIFDLKEAPANPSYFNSLKEAQKKLKGKVNFLSIIIDENAEKPDPETIKIANALDWTVLLDGKKWSSAEVKKYDIRTAPYMILVSADGLIEERDVALDSLIVSYEQPKMAVR